MGNGRRVGGLYASARLELSLPDMGLVGERLTTLGMGVGVGDALLVMRCEAFGRSRVPRMRCSGQLGVAAGLWPAMYICGHTVDCSFLSTWKGIECILYVQRLQYTPFKCLVAGAAALVSAISYKPSPTVGYPSYSSQFLFSVPCGDCVSGALLFFWSSLKISPRFSKLSGAMRFLRQ